MLDFKEKERHRICQAGGGTRKGGGGGENGLSFTQKKERQLNSSPAGGQVRVRSHRERGGEREKKALVQSSGKKRGKEGRGGILY